MWKAIGEIVARIMVVTSHPPLASGGHLVIAEALTRALRDAGHQSGLLCTPQNRFGRQGSAYVANWLTDVGRSHDGHSIDQVISLRFPSYAVRHNAHVCWLNHRMREYYDQWPVFSASLSARAHVKEAVRRRLLHFVDGYLLKSNVSKVFAQSRTIQERLKSMGSIPSTVVYPPPPQRPYRCDGYGGSILVISRLTPLKRVNLVIDALAQPAAAGVRCVIVGDGECAQSLREQVTHYGIEDRVHFRGAVGDSELLDELARCRTVCYPAYQEDYGLVTAEAFAAGKSVITCNDSGGPAELVVDGQSGFVTEPERNSLSQAFAILAEDAALAERMGVTARQQIAAISWEDTLERLLLV